eukprot:CAMPEP_0114501440 /NCGR_PEP_ID=MMETSP0109-20121206/8498_1 /TAXON_ID=29199 /ORGANISM="Chlorarachnion reptans, Strain CCCM449" /LENGTH=854 /DNA_ID=CAMNT_0001679167 /DNA_START=147 /DNA_END=2711 /DNA_ORIENTATION=+
METARLSNASLGRACYTDLSRLHEVGSFDLRNWVITNEEQRSSDGTECLIKLPKAELKTALRKGIPSFQRQCTWPRLVCEDFKRENIGQYSELLLEVFYGNIPQECSKEVSVPDFGGALMFRSHPITSEGREEVKQFLCVLKHCFVGNVEFCPVFPDLCAILLHYVSPDVAYIMIKNMVDRALVDAWHFPVTGLEFASQISNFLDLLPAQLPILARHFQSVGFSLEDTFKVWFGRLYVSYLPYDTVLRILDIYLNEGSKTIVRVAFGVLKIHGKDLLRCETAESLSRVLAENMRTKTETDQLLKIAMKFKVQRAQLKAKLDPCKVERLPVAKVQVFHVPKYEPESYNVMTTAQCRRLWTFLPPLLRVTDPAMWYATYRDGFSLTPILRCMKRSMEQQRPAILLIQDTRENLFGAVLDWRPGCVAGSDTFLFTLHPIAKQYRRSLAPPALIRHLSDGKVATSGTAKPAPFMKKMRSRGFVEERSNNSRTSSSETGPGCPGTPTSPSTRLRQIFPGGSTRLSITKQELSDHIEDLNPKVYHISADPRLVHQVDEFNLDESDDEPVKCFSSFHASRAPVSVQPTGLRQRKHSSGLSRFRKPGHAADNEDRHTSSVDSLSYYSPMDRDLKAKASGGVGWLGSIFSGSRNSDKRSCENKEFGNASNTWMEDSHFARKKYPRGLSSTRDSGDWANSQTGKYIDSGANAVRQSISYNTFDRLKKARRDRLSRVALAKEVESFRSLVANHVVSTINEVCDESSSYDTCSACSKARRNSRNSFSGDPHIRNCCTCESKVPRLQITNDHLILSWDGRIALALNSDVSVGFTHRTLGWNNPPLTKVNKLDNSFEVRHIELWGFDG